AASPPPPTRTRRPPARRGRRRPMQTGSNGAEPARRPPTANGSIGPAKQSPSVADGDNGAAPSAGCPPGPSGTELVGQLVEALFGKLAGGSPPAPSANGRNGHAGPDGSGRRPTSRDAGD